MNMPDLEKIKKVYFIGIGGIGISALARMMLAEGKEVSGTNDQKSPDTLGMLEKQGVPIYFDRDISHIAPDTDLIIYSTAWDQNEGAFMEQAHELGIPILTYAQALGFISKGKYTVAVSGTHGKTTTTAMIAGTLIDAKKDPTVIVGSLMAKVKSNFVKGESGLFVVEACEYKRSFLNFSPSILVITNIEEDHLDYYKDLEDIQNAFAELAMKVPKEGFIVCNPGDPNVKPVLENTKATIVDYTREDLDVDLPVLGEYNRQNARAALAVVKALGVPSASAQQSLSQFSGTWRRQEFKGETKSGVKIYDDYAHHPTEIQKTLAGFRERYKDETIVVVFQPHLYSRTKFLLKDFAKSFNDVDEVVVADIYAAREVDDGSITEEMVVGQIKKYNKNVQYIGDFKATESYLKKELKKDDILITMGAGNVHEIGEDLL